MTPIQWSDKYSVNVPEIDEQHQYLIDIFNDFQSTATVHQTNASLIRSIFNELAIYTNRHFDAEEQLLKIHNYPDFEAHKKQHDLLSEQLFDLQMDFVRGNNVEITSELLGFLKNWLTKHILGSDQKYSSFMSPKEGMISVCAPSMDVI